MFGTARHKVVDYCRAQEQDKRKIWTADIECIADSDQDIERILERSELREALGTIAPKQRIALLLHYADGLSVQEVAVELSKSVHAVESLLTRGRQNLRRVLSSQEQAV